MAPTGWPVVPGGVRAVRGEPVDLMRWDVGPVQRSLGRVPATASAPGQRVGRAAAPAAGLHAAPTVATVRPFPTAGDLPDMT